MNFKNFLVESVGTIWLLIIDTGQIEHNNYLDDVEAFSSEENLVQRLLEVMGPELSDNEIDEEAEKCRTVNEILKFIKKHPYLNMYEDVFVIKKVKTS